MTSGKVGRKWTKREDAMLGTDTDEAIGKKLGVHKTTVWKRRVMKGIPSFDEASGGKGSLIRKLPGDETLMAEVASLGGMRAVSRKYGVSVQAVSLMVAKIKAKSGGNNGDHDAGGPEQHAGGGEPERPR